MRTLDPGIIAHLTGKKLREVLADAKIFNEHDLLQKGQPWIHRRRANRRSMLPGGWMVSVKGKKFKGAPWYDYGSKWFDEDLEGAKKFCEEKLGVVAWAKSPFMPLGKYPTWIPKSELERVLEKITEEL